MLSKTVGKYVIYFQYLIKSISRPSNIKCKTHNFALLCSNSFKLRFRVNIKYYMI